MILSHFGSNKIIARTYSYKQIYKSLNNVWSLVSTKFYDEELECSSFVSLNDSQILLYNSENLYLLTYY